MEIIGSSLAKATRIFPVMDCFQTHNRWGCSAKKWVSRENGGRESGVQKRLKGENNLGEKTAGICLIDSMHTISRGGLFLLCFSFLVSFFLSFLFFFWFCFHAKLDYFYGAIYSTKFTTTMLLGGQVRPFPWRQTSGQMSDVAPIQWRFVDVFGGYSSFHSIAATLESRPTAIVQ